MIRVTQATRCVLVLALTFANAVNASDEVLTFATDGAAHFTAYVEGAYRAGCDGPALSTPTGTQVTNDAIAITSNVLAYPAICDPLPTDTPYRVAAPLGSLAGSYLVTWTFGTQLSGTLDTSLAPTASVALVGDRTARVTIDPPTGQCNTVTPKSMSQNGTDIVITYDAPPAASAASPYPQCNAADTAGHSFNVELPLQGTYRLRLIGEGSAAAMIPVELQFAVTAPSAVPASSPSALAMLATSLLVVGSLGRRRAI